MIEPLDVVNGLLLFFVKPIVALTLALYLVNSSNFRAAAANHWIMTIAIISPLALVTLYFLLPQFDVCVLPESLTTVLQYQEGSLSSGFINIYVVLIFIYLLGLVSVLAYMAHGIVSIWIKTIYAKSISDRAILKIIGQNKSKFLLSKPIKTVFSERIQSPMVWGILSPSILLPEQAKEWSEGTLSRVIAHELAHIVRRDWAIKTLATVCCALFWFVPLIWFAKSKLLWLAEIASDDLVIEKLNCRAEYADDLLLISSELKERPFAMPFIRKSDLYKRIDAILDGSRVRKHPQSYFKFAVIVMTALLLLPMATVKAVSIQRDTISNYSTYVPLELVIEGIESETTVETHSFDIEGIEIIPLKEIQSNTIWNNSTIQEKYVFEAFKISHLKDNNFKPKSDFNATSTPVALAAIDRLMVEKYLPINTVTPEYPRRALQKSIEGRVSVIFDIDECGNVTNPKIISSQPVDIFDSAVLRAIKKYKFKPLMVDGNHIITKNVVETFVFKIEDTTDTPKINPESDST